MVHNLYTYIGIYVFIYVNIYAFIYRQTYIYTVYLTRNFSYKFIFTIPKLTAFLSRFFFVFLHGEVMNILKAFALTFFRKIK